MDRGEIEQVWKAFWSRRQTTTTPSIVSSQWNSITRAQFDSWTGFTACLTQGARVLDLATGSGILPEMLRQARPDLQVVGVDIADPLPPAPNGVQLIGGISMESLPFENAQFDAAVSQFGFEYGDTDATSEEVLRVVKPGAPIGLMIHRGDGPILAHNLRRQEQIVWIKDDNALFDRVFELLPEGDTLAEEAVAFAQKLAKDGASRFGQGSVAWEIPEAVRRTLLLGANGAREKLVGTLELIAEQAEGELGRIQSLAKACAHADDRQALLAGFEKHNRRPIETVSVRLPDDAAFADLIII